jgi:pre-60S factor REI1
MPWKVCRPCYRTPVRSTHTHASNSRHTNIHNSKTFDTETKYEQHARTKKHQKKAEKGNEKAKAAAAAGDDDYEMVDVDDGKVKAKAEPQPIEPGSCMFCPKKFKGQNAIADSLAHMLTEHGFFVPFIEYLADIEGLLVYLGYKVGVGCVCLYCNGRGRASYGSLYAVQAHMSDKSHCKVRMEDEDEEELLEFYDFSITVAEKARVAAAAAATDAAAAGGDEAGGAAMSSSSSSASTSTSTAVVILDQDDSRIKAPKRTPVDINDLGELILSDGTIIGHRDYKHEYKKNVRVQDPIEAQIVERMVQEYRLLGVAAPQKPTDAVMMRVDQQKRKNHRNNTRRMYMENRINGKYTVTMATLC